MFESLSSFLPSFLPFPLTFFFSLDNKLSLSTNHLPPFINGCPCFSFSCRPSSFVSHLYFQVPSHLYPYGFLPHYSKNISHFPQQYYVKTASGKVEKVLRRDLRRRQLHSVAFSGVTEDKVTPTSSPMLLSRSHCWRTRHLSLPPQSHHAFSETR